MDNSEILCGLVDYFHFDLYVLSCSSCVHRLFCNDFFPRLYNVVYMFSAFSHYIGAFDGGQECRM